VPPTKNGIRGHGSVRLCVGGCGCVWSPPNAAEGMARPSPPQWEKRAAAAMRRGLRAAHGMGRAASGPPTVAQRARTFFHSETAHEGVAQLPGQAAFRDEVHRHLGKTHQGPVAQPRLLSRTRAGYVTSRGHNAQRTPEAQRHATTTLPSTTADAIPLGQQWWVYDFATMACVLWWGCGGPGRDHRGRRVRPRGRGGGAQSKGAAGEEALRVHFARGRF
jgi:hypothetical protein